MEALTEEQFKNALPDGMKKQVNPLLVARINNTLSKPEEWSIYRDNLLGFSHILKQGKFKLENYLNAVKYVGFKIMGLTNKDAYRNTFPDKYAKFQADGVASKDIASYTTAFHKSKLVMLMLEQAIIPVWLLNADKMQAAINVQSSIMLNEEASFKVRSDAANSVMTHLKPPEKNKVELDIGPIMDNTINVYKQAMTEMVKKQQELIKAGGDVKAIANASIKPVEGEVIDI